MNGGIGQVKDIEKFVEDGFREVQEKSKAFDEEFANTSKRIEGFREQMRDKKGLILNKVADSMKPEDLREGEVYQHYGPGGQILTRTVLKIGEPEERMLRYKKHENGEESQIPIKHFLKILNRHGVKEKL
ncbi:hypothetical protein HP398_29770 [Brevibacillus sp. HB1.4B]|uniref:hypothetical protein n=1 Tax=Brevibacillus sp. HB1.4B TaxID=2738845 RepID=UPI00156BA4A7|nr:hypothetical protein [Brevibacillus sp. HB1.4B]NRS20611.1 hypothetical protein [Brevibacillus sp. HB1.4B]